MACKILNGKQIAADLRKDMHGDVQKFIQETGTPPCLGVILSSMDPASEVYVQNKRKACNEVGIRSLLVHPFSKKKIEEWDDPWVELKRHICEWNDNPDVHGILVQLPLPPPLRKRTLDVFELINPLKDVDVFHPTNAGLLVQNRPRFLPCTPHGIQVILRHSNIDPSEKHVVIINRSDIVGKPLSSMLIQDNEYANATVTVCHDRTPPKALKAMSLMADILIVAVGIPHFIKADMVKPGATVIDVGITRKEGKLYGDVDFDAVKYVAGALTPVPGGVGPMTVAMLLVNTLIAARLCTHV